MSGGLVAALASDDDPQVVSVDPATADAEEAGPTVTDAAPDTVIPDTGPASTPETTVDDGPIRENTARIAGVTYIETASCLAFPNSNPNAGIGDAHINASLHRLEATDGSRVIVEQWSEDGFARLRLTEPSGRVGDAPSQRREAPADIEPVTETMAMSDGTTVMLEHALARAVTTCPHTLLVGPDDFTFDAYGTIEVCSASTSSGLGHIATFQGATVLQFVRTADESGYDARIVGVFDDATEFDVAFTLADSFDPPGVIVGTVPAGALSGDRGAVAPITVELGVGSEPPCAPAQEQRFAE